MLGALGDIWFHLLLIDLHPTTDDAWKVLTVLTWAQDSILPVVSDPKIKDSIRGEHKERRILIVWLDLLLMFEAIRFSEFSGPKNMPNMG